MTIEPCICHFEYPEQYTVDANCWYIYCPRCGARGAFGATVEKAIQEWDRPARIVRAAEAWVKAVRFEEDATSGKRCVPTKVQSDAQDWLTEAEEALLEAVEGGAE